MASSDGISPDRTAQMRNQWLCTVLGWDGCLPLLISLSPLALCVFLDPGLAGLCATGVSMAAALYRAHRGRSQLNQLSEYLPRTVRAKLIDGLREVLFAGAIIALFLFELMSGLLHCNPRLPRTLWFFVAAMYIVYLVLVALALWPSASGDQPPFEENRA